MDFFFFFACNKTVRDLMSLKELEVNMSLETVIFLKTEVLSVSGEFTFRGHSLHRAGTRCCRASSGFSKGICRSCWGRFRSCSSSAWLVVCFTSFSHASSQYTADQRRAPWEGRNFIYIPDWVLLTLRLNNEISYSKLYISELLLSETF